ncbi:MAG TPA: MBL fold metallo-hydrolase [Solirubrobacteraceae bacterium]|jgi:glyoxylase-like metal-dependent hydrolase (beta-lactamase superfamily II)|nr:MBL fold metallo-hydrolase [Solirubrobacteraceae bacterium]
MREIDLHHLGNDRVICCWQAGEVLVDPGPESTVSTLMDTIGDRAPRALLLTHIHLDHAGATGALVRAFPDLKVYVHELGAPHLIDPSKLLRSAGRLYGEDNMDRMWGETVPVPEENIALLRGGETVEGFRVAYAPGHASHHVAYLHEDSGWAFTGDVAGVRIARDQPIVPPTPPPDIDVEAWLQSIDTVQAWDPAALALTHFGAYEDVAAHLDTLRAALRKQADWVRDLDEPEFRARRRAWVDDAPVYEQAAPSDQMWQGLERYWRKRAERDAA